MSEWERVRVRVREKREAGDSLKTGEKASCAKETGYAYDRGMH